MRRGPAALQRSRSPRAFLATLYVACALWLPSCGAARTGATATPAPPQLRVLTLNTFAGNDLDRRSNLARVAALLDSLEIGVAFLQEVDRRTGRSGGVDQADSIGRLANMHVAFGRAMDYDGGEYGIAILSRLPLGAVTVVPLPVQPTDTAGQPTEPRVLLHVVARSGAGPLHLLNTHLDHRGAASGRHQQVVQLLAYVADNVPRGAAAILAGDMNATPGMPEVRAVGVAFADAWTACGRGDGATFRADAPDRRIDYVFLAGARCTAARVIDVILSDHRAVTVDVQLPTGGRER